MTERRIRKYGAEVLRKPSKNVSDFGKKTQTLFRDLEETLEKVGGLGLAAPQIGVNLRAFVALDKEKGKIFKIVNPEIVFVDSETVIDMEGCLSFPEIFFAIPRPKRVVVKGYTDSGKSITIEASDILARCFAHEIDHLNGVLIIDHASRQEKEFWKEKISQLVAISKK
ncbi:MAG: peptide deformylase [Candidatus Omnitrophica bacterium]|nr:peptide deformylase [Candidatus Omnitrophota bacterium]